MNFWYDIDRKAKAVIDDGKPRISANGKIRLTKEKGFLRIQLPSGRQISYPKPRMTEGKFGPVIGFDGQGAHVGFTTVETYGGKLVENIVQATARDVLAEGIKRIESAGFKTVFHVHDEVIIEAPEDDKVETINDLLSITPDWADGLPLGAEGFSTKYYMKD